MELITIESQAFSRLMQKLEHISAYVEEARQREEEERLHRESERADGRKRNANQEVCEALEISPRTLQRYRTKGIVPYSIIGKLIRYPRKEIEHIREQWVVETPAMRLDRIIQAHPIHELKKELHAKKRRHTGKNQ